MENQTSQQPVNAQIVPKNRKGGRCCLAVGGVGVIVFLLLFILLVIMGQKLGAEREARLDGLMDAVAQGDIVLAHTFFAKQYRDRNTPEDLEALVDEYNLKRHTAREWHLGAEDEYGNRIYEGTITLRDGSKKVFYLPVVDENDKWCVVALLTEEPKLPTVDESGDGTVEWGFSFTSATLDNIRITDKDSPAALDKSEFPDDVEEIYCLGEINWAPSDTKVMSKWYYLGPEGKDAETELVSKGISTTQNSMTLRFNLFRKGPLFPKGHYRVRLFVDGKQQVTKDFVVRQPNIEELKKRGEAGDSLALFRLGGAYVAGIGVEADPAKGLQYIKRAAEAGLPAAQYQYGVELHNGNRLPKNQEEAVKWIRKAAEQDDPDAQYDLGVFYRDGVGVPKDLTEAVVWTRKAAEQGDALAQYNLGIHYKMGVGVTEDFAQAAKWFKLAAGQNYVPAMFSLAELHENGAGVNKDIDEAVRLYQSAAEQGNEAAKAALQRLGK